MNKKMVCSMYCIATVDASMTPRIGKKTKGRKEVTPRSTGSKIHHMAIHTNTHAVPAIGCDNPCRDKITKMISAAIGPSKILNNLEFIG